MTDQEFDVLDELYFLQSFSSLEKALKINGDELSGILQILIEKGWVRCFSNPVQELKYDKGRYQKEYRNYYYLASKEGLLAHNSNF